MLIWSYWPGPEGGAERQCRKLVSVLQKRGMSCTVLTHWPSLKVPRIEWSEGVEIRRVGVLGPFTNWILRKRDAVKSRLGRDSRAAIATTAGAVKPARKAGPTMPLRWLDTLLFMVEAYFFVRHRRREFQILHIHESHWLGGFGAWMGVRAGIPSVCKEAFLPCLLDLDAHVPFRKVWDTWRKRPIYLAMHRAIGDCLASKGIPRDRLLELPNGVEIPEDQADVIKNSTVLFVGNFPQGAHHKAFDSMIEAWALVQQRKSEAKLVIVGAGDSTLWLEYARKHSCADTITFAGAVNDVAPFFRTAAVFVLPSRREGMSNALLEAQSWGIPAVVSDIPGNTAVVEDGETGLVVPVGHSAALADAVLKLLHDSELRVRMGRSARERMQRRFGFAEIADTLEKEYQLIARKPSATGLSG